MPTHVETVLVAICLILVLEAVSAIIALILLLKFMSTAFLVSLPVLPGHQHPNYLSSTAVSTFLGFFGQHSHMKNPWILALLGLLTSVSFRGGAKGLLSLIVR